MRQTGEATLDLRGLRCPLPALRTEKALRRAAPDALGAHGSWTWTMSSGRTESAPSIARETSTGSDEGRPRPPGRGGGSRG